MDLWGLESSDKQNFFSKIGSAVANGVNIAWERVSYFHFEGRDEKNIITESYDEILESSRKPDGDWTLLDYNMSIYHQNGIGEAELKFINKDGREAVFTKDFSDDGTYQLYTDPRYKGTYNYCNPCSFPETPKEITNMNEIGNYCAGTMKALGKSVGHFVADMLPYYITGKRNERNQ